MATAQVHEVSTNIWISTQYSNNQPSIEVRKSLSTAPLCCITPCPGGISLTFLHGSTCLYWKECLTTPEQFTILDGSENILFTVNNQDDQKLFTLSQNGKLIATITAKISGAFFLSCLTNTTINIPKSKMEVVLDTFSSKDKTAAPNLEPNVLPAQNNDQLSVQYNAQMTAHTNENLPANESTNVETISISSRDSSITKNDFALTCLGFDILDYV